MKRRTPAIPALAALLAPMLTACGTGDHSASTPIRVGTTDRVTATQDAPAPLDPAYAYDTGSWNILRQTLQTLMAQPKGDGDLVPEAAQECGFTDTGSERYACTLREGLTFADGTPVTAQAVKFSVDRALALKADSGVASLLNTVDTVETQGTDQVVFHLKTADATFPYKLSTPVAGIVNPADYRADTFREGFTVDGSGPYTLKAETDDDHVTKAVLTKNPRYKGTFKPANDRVELISYDDADAMDAALGKGDLDVMTRTMTPRQIDKYASAPAGSGTDLVDLAGLETRYLVFNTAAPPVQNKAVRQAVAQLVDRDALIAAVYATQADPLYSLVPNSVANHTNAFFNRYGDPDAGKARTLLGQAKVPTPVKLTLNYTTDHYGPATKQEFTELKRQLDASGLFQVTLQGAPWDTYVPAGRKGGYAVYGMGWFPDFPDPDNFLAPFLDRGNVLNSPYVNTEITDTLIPQSRRAADRKAAAQPLAAIQALVAEDVPVLPLWQGKQYVAAHDDITGTAYALNSSATLRLWELGRGTG